jgi:cell division protein FtsW
LIHLGILVVLVGLVYYQPDFSTSMMIFIIGYLMFYISGMKLLHLTATFVTLLLPIIIVIAIIQPYRLDRFTTFFSPKDDIAGKGWQVEQSLIGFGNGGFGGVGLGESRQKEFYLPEPHNDFIFSIIGDEFGYFGTTIVILLYILLIQRGFAIAKNAPDFYGFLLANGITIAIAVYAIFNMAITIGLVPPTGLPLPLVSYGGTSLIMTMFSLGVLLNISYKSNQMKLGNEQKIK